MVRLYECDLLNYLKILMWWWCCILECLVSRNSLVGLLEMNKKQFNFISYWNDFCKQHQNQQPNSFSLPVLCVCMFNTFFLTLQMYKQQEIFQRIKKKHAEFGVLKPDQKMSKCFISVPQSHSQLWQKKNMYI